MRPFSWPLAAIFAPVTAVYHLMISPLSNASPPGSVSSKVRYARTRVTIVVLSWDLTEGVKPVETCVLHERVQVGVETETSFADTAGLADGTFRRRQDVTSWAKLSGRVQVLPPDESCSSSRHRLACQHWRKARSTAWTRCMSFSIVGYRIVTGSDDHTISA